MNLVQAEKISYIIIAWCIVYFGKSKYHNNYPMVFTRYELNKKEKCCGEYDADHNVILIYTKLNQTPYQLIGTVIHEYVHYLQSPIWATRYSKKYGWKYNPYEYVAEITAKELSNQCEKEIKYKINRIMRKKNGNSKSDKT